jgi:vancomycin permeability regulator SanA
MLSHKSLIKSIELDGEALARAYNSPRRFKKLVDILKRNGASDGDIVRALAGVKTLISALRVNR